MSAVTEETLRRRGILLGKTFGAAGRGRSSGSAASTGELAALQIRQAMVGRWFFMIIGTIFSIMPGVRVLARRHAGRQRRPERARRPATSSPSRRSRAGSSSRSASCSTSRSRSRARSRCSTGSSSTSTWTRRSSTRPTPSRWSPATVRGARRASRASSFRYPAEPAVARPAAEATCADGGRARRRAPEVAEAALEAADGRPPTVDAAERRRGRARPTSLRRRSALEDVVFEAAPGRAGRARRAVGRRQDHDDLPDPAAVRRRRRAGRDRRHRRPQVTLAVARAGSSGS